MSAGAVQLAAIGQQDAYLTGSPSVSYFTGVYRRHTPFTLQAFTVPFQGQQVQWGSQAVCRIPYKGDLVRSVMVAVDLPSLSPSSTEYIWRLPVRLQRPVPYLYIDGNLTSPVKVNAVGVDTYSTGNFPLWLGPSALATKISYDSTKTKFFFQNCSNVTLNTADVTTVGVFFGLDPHSYSRFPTSNTVQWDVSPGSTHGNYSDLSLAQSGWIPASSAATVSASETYIANVFAPVTLNSIVPSPNGTWAQFVNLNLFGPRLGIASLITVTPGGCFKFAFTGTYMLVVTLNVSLPVSRIGVGSQLADGHPVGAWTWNEFSYEILVMPMPQTPLAVIPIICTDTNKNYFLDVETQFALPVTIGTTGQGTEISITDVNEFYRLGTNQTLVGATANLAVNWAQTGFFQDINVLKNSNTFSFFDTGLYHLKGTLYTTGSNIFSVTLSNAAVGPITTWSTTQTRSPTINFTLPVQVWNKNDQYKITVRTDTPATLTSNSFFASEQFGIISPLSASFENLKRNGLLFTGNTQALITLGTVWPVNFNLTMNDAGLSQFISVTTNGNIQFSRIGIYKFLVYFEVPGSYVSSVGLFQNTADVRPATPIYQTTSQLSIGTFGPYTIEVCTQCTDTSNVFFLDVTTIGTGTALMSANAYVTVMCAATPLPNTYNYVDSVGTYMIEKAELKIGGQLIQTLTGEAIEIYNDLAVSQENQTGLTLLTGKMDLASATQDRTYYVNLPFYFYGANELSVPVCSLQRQDMEIYVTFRPFMSLVARNTVVTQTNVTASMIVEYAYLSDPEVNWMNNHVLDYVITQLQYETFNLGQSTVVDLGFTGPVRELFFVIQDKAATPYVYVTDLGIGAAITLNGEDLLDPTTTDYQFMHIIQPLEKHTRQPDRAIYMYSFARRPQDPRPSGSINMSRIKQKKFQIFLPGTTSLETKELRVIAVSYNVLRVSNGLAGLMYD
jgi:hypothetical protein